MKRIISICLVTGLLTAMTVTYVFASSININLGAAATRISGETRYDTSYEISRKYGKAGTAFIVNGQNFPDALAVSPLAAALNAPVLLSNGKSVTKELSGRLEDMEATRVYIIGGTAAISSAMETALREKYSVIRLSGKDRFETCIAIARELCKYSDPEECYFTCATNYPDALAISSVACLNKAPIIYINKNGTLNDSVIDFLNERPIAKAVILGKYGAVSSKAEETLDKFPFTLIHRIGGADRYETMLLINNVYGYLFRSYAICIATGENFPDALSGSVFAAKVGAPIVLVPSNLAADSKIVKYVKDSSPDLIYIFGGESAVSNKTLSAFSA